MRKVNYSSVSKNRPEKITKNSKVNWNPRYSIKIHSLQSDWKVYIWNLSKANTKCKKEGIHKTFYNKNSQALYLIHRNEWHTIIIIVTIIITLSYNHTKRCGNKNILNKPIKKIKPNCSNSDTLHLSNSQKLNLN